jgi:hypothetical protein
MAKPLRERPYKIAHYYDAHSKASKTIEYIAYRSMAGRVSGVEYRVSYRLRDGRWLNGLRHQDRGNLMTDVEINAKPWVTSATAPNDGAEVSS